MPGVRVQHPTARNVRCTIVEPDRPYPVPFVCTPPEFGGCGSTHLFKTHHITLDESGAAIVSETVYERVKGRLALEGFITNPVAKPPPIVVGLGHGQGAFPGISVLQIGKEPT